jgi:DNA-binding MarR family transcriptional regulator
MYMHDMAMNGSSPLTGREILESCACHKVRLAARTVTRTYDDALRPCGLRASQLPVLVAVGIEGAISITALAELLGMDRSTLTRSLKPLENAGLVSVGVEGWRRSRTLAITKKGWSRLQQALPLWESAQQTLQRKLNDRNWAAVHSGLEHLVRVS